VAGRRLLDVQDAKPMNAWIAKARDLARNLSLPARRHEPVCFVVGAGASLSSGAPSTSRVVDAFDRAFGGRLAGADATERRHAIDGFNESEKRAAIEPLFEGITPYVGYRCLAAMGRERRIFILNLNWDRAPEIACEMLGVPFDSLSLAEGEVRLLDALTKPGYGVVVVHLHGQWDRDVRLGYGTLETLSFSDDARKLLFEHALKHTTVVLGASLADDTDIHELLDHLADERSSVTASRPAWLFSRSKPVSATVHAAVRDFLSRRGSDLNWVAGEDIDADRLLVELRAGEVIADHGEHASFDSLRLRAVGVSLPPLEEIVWPAPVLLREMLSTPIVALVGEAALGKSTVAHLLAYWRTLWSDQVTEIKTLRGTSSSLIAISAAARTPDEGTVQLVIEDPFGQESFDSNPAFVPALQVLSARPDAPSAIITSRLYNWQEGFGDEDHGVLPDAALSESDPLVWYSTAALVAYLKSRGALEFAEHQEKVLERELNTPQRIVSRIAGFLPRPEDPGNTHDKARLLGGLFASPLRRDMAMVIVLARLQELSELPQTERDLLALLGTIDPVPAWQRAKSMLFGYLMDGAKRIKLMHSTDRAAVDAFLREYRADVGEAIAELGPRAAWAVSALSVWDALQGARDDDTWSIADVPRGVRLAWAGPVVVQATEHSADRGWEAIDGLLAAPEIDFWALCEIVYETLRLWPLLAEPLNRADDFVDRILNDRHRMGAYAMLEAMLYLQAVTPVELWSPMQEKIVRLARSEGHDFELALLFDGLLWRPPAVGDDSKLQLFTALLDGARRRDGLIGGYRLAGAYHPAGASFLSRQSGLEDPSERLATFDQEQGVQAARMVRFHFVHQSRARVALARRPFEGGTIDYLFQTLYASSLDRDRAERLTGLIEDLAAVPGQAGWAVHLALNVGNTQGRFSEEQLARIAACLPRAVDDGVLAAVLTYEVHGALAAGLGKWFREEPSRRDAALDRLRDGFLFDGWVVRPPRFRFARDIRALWTLLGCDWPELNRLAEVPTDDPGRLLVSYERVADRAVTAYGADPMLVARLLERARAGDLRDFEGAARARDGDDPHLRSIVAAAALLRGHAEDQEQLF
jgi:hypothetical protein